MLLYNPQTLEYIGNVHPKRLHKSRNIDHLYICEPEDDITFLAALGRAITVKEFKDALARKSTRSR